MLVARAANAVFDLPGERCYAKTPQLCRDYGIMQMPFWMRKQDFYIRSVVMFEAIVCERAKSSVAIAAISALLRNLLLRDLSAIISTPQMLL